MTILLNGMQVKSAKVYEPWSGVWTADLDVDLELPIAPTGKAVLVLGTSARVCTVDPDASGLFGAHARVRVIGGGGGWHKEVSALHYHNDAGVLSTAVIASTAAAVGEVATDAIPSRLGADFMRSAGPASRVLAGRDWHVDPTTGTTLVAPRIPFPALPTLEILEWDPKERVATVASDEPVTPGTILIDPRFGTTTIRDVEATFDADGARATCWCDSEPSPGSRLTSAMASLAREATGVVYLRTYRYRVVTQGVDDRLVLQAVKRSAGMPDTLPISIWFGVPGVKAKLLLGSQVLVEFVNGDPSDPVVRAFESGPLPIELTLNAVRVAVGAGTEPVIKATQLYAWVQAVIGVCAAHTPPITIPPLSVFAASSKLFTD
jgi:hypothetical protein